MVFEPEEWGSPLPLSDHRSIHLREILKLSPGDSIRMGILDGNWGEGTYLGQEGNFLQFSWPEPVYSSPAPFPLHLLIGTPRPPTARRLIKDLTTLGAAELHFTSTALGEKSYLQSSLWTKGEYRENLLEGAQQAQTTRLPEVFTHTSLFKGVNLLQERHPQALRLAPDLPRHGEKALEWPAVLPGPAVLAIGPERGWTEEERGFLHSRGFQVVNLGPRNLRTETACTVAAAMLLQRYFW